MHSKKESLLILTFIILHKWMELLKHWTELSMTREIAWWSMLDLITLFGMKLYLQLYNSTMNSAVDKTPFEQNFEHKPYIGHINWEVCLGGKESPKLNSAFLCSLWKCKIWIEKNPSANWKSLWRSLFFRRRKFWSRKWTSTTTRERIAWKSWRECCWFWSHNWQGWWDWSISGNSQGKQEELLLQSLDSTNTSMARRLKQIYNFFSFGIRLWSWITPVLLVWFWIS